MLPGQAMRSWYMGYFQLPWLPERSASWMVPLLWRRWSPGYDAAEDLAHVDAAIGAPERWRAAVGFYRANLRPGSTPPKQYVDLHRHYLSALTLPTLYMHGADDGCMTVKLADRVPPVLAADGRMRIVEHRGHFLQLEQPSAVARHILDFVGRRASCAGWRRSTRRRTGCRPRFPTISSCCTGSPVCRPTSGRRWASSARTPGAARN